MGSTNETASGKGTNPEEVYHSLVEEALSEYGHDSYNGTISTSNGWFMWDNLGPRHSAAAWNTIDQAWDSSRLQKWEAWGCIPLASEDSFSTITKKVTVDLPLTDHDNDTSNKVIAEKVRLTSGQFISDHKLIDTDEKYKIERIPRPGKLITKYTAGVREFDTMAEAAAYCGDLALHSKVKLEGQRDRGLGFYTAPTSFLVNTVTKRADGGPIDGYKLVRTRNRRTFEVTVAKPKAKMTTEGFIFFGWAAC